MISSILIMKNKINTIVLDMRNFITNFRKTLGICKQFAGNQANEKGNVARCGVVLMTTIHPIQTCRTSRNHHTISLKMVEKRVQSFQNSYLSTTKFLNHNKLFFNKLKKTFTITKTKSTTYNHSENFKKFSHYKIHYFIINNTKNEYTFVKVSSKNSSFLNKICIMG